MNKMPNEERRLTRSVRIRKYESAYRKYMKKRDGVDKEPRVHRMRHKHRSSSKNSAKSSPKEKERKKKRLTDYQKFVKKESCKDKYENMRGSQRMKAISIEWGLYKKRLSKRIEKKHIKRK